MAEPYHVRGDARLARTAVLRNWLRGDPEGQDALCAVLFDAKRAWGDKAPMLAHLSHQRRWMTFLVMASTMVEMTRQNQIDEHHAIDKILWPNRRAAGERGRPWTRWKAAPARPKGLDARELQPVLAAHGAAGKWWLPILIETSGEPTQRLTVRLWSIGRGIAGRFVVFVCPKCDRRAVMLYPARRGLGCRGCAGVTYGGTRAP
jgi:hypothetical protein